VRILVLFLLLSVLGSLPAAGDEPSAEATGDDLTDELIAREKIRSAVDAVLTEYAKPAGDGEVRNYMATVAVEGFLEIGPEAVPYLINELQQEKVGTFDLTSYALGMLATPESIRALQDSMSRADEDTGDAARARKAWAAWGLGLAGQTDVVRLLIEGPHQTAIYPMFGKTTLIEAVAIETAPDSVPALLEMLDVVMQDPERWQDRRNVLRALRRVHAPSAAPKIVALLENTERTVRRDAVSTLRTMDTPGSVTALQRALGDEDFTVRRSAAASLEYLGRGRQARLVERLEVEGDAYTRGALYRLLAETRGSKAFDQLVRFRGRSDVSDRRYLAEAIGLIEHPARIEFLTEMLADENNGVAFEAARRLAELGQVDPLIEAVATARLPVARSAAEQLGLVDSYRAGPAIAKRLLGDVLSRPVTEPRDRVPMEKMTWAVVRLGHTDSARALRDAAERQPDAGIQIRLRQAAKLLETIAGNKRDLAAWLETSRDDDPEVRALAWRHIGRIGDEASASSLVAAFDQAERGDRRAILRALGRGPEAPATPLLERVLLDPFFDHPHENGLRDMAAWSARRIGGPKMLALLETAARRRNGQDPRVMIYAAVLGAKGSLPLLHDLRRPRMRYLGWARGIEQERLDWVAERIGSGRSIEDVDVPPRKIVFR
jgi:HEAT repeat protein